MKIYEDIKKIKGIGEKTAGLYNKVGIYTVEDLLNYYPRIYTKYPECKLIGDTIESQNEALYLMIEKDFTFKKVRNLSVGSGRAVDRNNTPIEITFFNTPYYKEKLLRGRKYVFYGRVKYEYKRYIMEQPQFFELSEYEEKRKVFWPVYMLTKGLSNKMLLKGIKAALEDENYADLYEEYLPETIISEFNLCKRKEAIKNIHFPLNEEELIKARRRLSFDELFVFISMLKMMKGKSEREKSFFEYIETAGPIRLIEKLPYRLTGAQKRVYEEIAEELCEGYVTNRLIQGDVGSGKTIVSFLLLLLTKENGYQGALMAPTELLAGQHFENLSLLNNTYGLNLSIALLTGSVSKKKKEEIYEALKSGEIDIVIGTHAIIQDKVEFKKLSLVITDEQHRFGVMQRLSLAQKGNKPHIIVMSATPIPRTLAIVLYGDMKVSVIDEKPSNRLAIKNCVVNQNYRSKAYAFIEKQIREGHQCYVVCPMVDASEEMPDIENVYDYSEKLKKNLSKDVSIGILHGQMKAEEKRKVMEAFLQHNIDVLVSTTVIEVGIDVPNATVMMVEDAQMFGLSQLHQLRGRIGRGDSQSYTIFVNSNENSSNKQRLDILNRTNDGFELANEDLKIRGAGDLFGIRQSGDFDFKIADIYDDSEMLIKLETLITNIMNVDFDMKEKEHIKMREFIEENSHNYIDFDSI